MRSDLDFWLVCEVDDASRKCIAQTLKDIGVKKINQYNNLEQLLSLSSGLLSADAPATKSEGDLNGVICTLNEGIVFTCRALSLIRKNLPNCLIIVIADKLSISEMSQLVQVGVSQILMNPIGKNKLNDKIKQAALFQSRVCEERKQNSVDLSFANIVSNSEESFVLVRLMGWISENSTLPKIKSKHPNQTLLVDCERVDGINSVGIRLWLLWLKQLEANGFIKIEFENMHKSLMGPISPIKGFLGSKGVLNSFYLIYSDPLSDNEIEVKFIRGQNFDEKYLKVPKNVEMVVKGKKSSFEYDASSLLMFSFYDGEIKIV